MGRLVKLVANSVLGRSGAGGDRGIIIFSDLLVGLLRSLGARTLEGLGDVVGGVLTRLGDVVGSVLEPELVMSLVQKIGTNRGSVHFEVKVWLT